MWQIAREPKAALHTSHNQAFFPSHHCTWPFKAGHARFYVISVGRGSGEPWGQLDSFPIIRALIFLSQGIPSLSLKSNNFTKIYLVVDCLCQLFGDTARSFNICIHILQFQRSFLNYILQYLFCSLILVFFSGTPSIHKIYIVHIYIYIYIYIYVWTVYIYTCELYI